ncbi:30S ribosomal protein S19e [Candidatus Woesearchaeota archaeon]|nr:30S ribosomal protein S19e [Candidatus Woesearchaeota archaeon]
MASVLDVDPTSLIEEAAKELKKMPEMAPPVWAAYVKTGRHNERPPAREDWWYVRSAAVLRNIYKLGPVGVSKLRTKYGGRRNRGMAPDRTYKGSGNIIRKIMQKLELVGFVKQEQKGVHKGRVITAQGKSFLDKVASSLYKAPLNLQKQKEEKDKTPVKHKAEAKSQVEQEEKKVEVKKKKTDKEEEKKTEEQPEHKPKEEKPKKEEVKKEKKEGTKKEEKIKEKKKSTKSTKK